MIFVTGAGGSVGTALCSRLRKAGESVVATDSGWYDGGLDVTNEDLVHHWLGAVKPDLIYHLAGAKHAFDGELNPGKTVMVNTIGTRNVLRYAGDAKVVMASTCKACDPETAYGASKLIAERMVLNAGGIVVRYFNIPESSGNVFRLWEEIPEPEPIPWTDCWRYFNSMDKAINLTLHAGNWVSGRYAPDPGEPRHMHEVAAELYPDRKLKEIPRRRGDRFVEPLHAECETWRQKKGGFLQIKSPYDPQQRWQSGEVESGRASATS